MALSKSVYKYMIVGSYGQVVYVVPSLCIVLNVMTRDIYIYIYRERERERCLSIWAKGEVRKLGWFSTCDVIQG